MVRHFENFRFWYLVFVFLFVFGICSWPNGNAHWISGKILSWKMVRHFVVRTKLSILGFGIGIWYLYLAKWTCPLDFWWNFEWKYGVGICICICIWLVFGIWDLYLAKWGAWLKPDGQYDSEKVCTISVAQTVWR